MDDWSEETGVEMDNFPMVEGGDDKNIMQYQMKIPDALDAIAKAGKSLQYVESTQCYHVIDGAAFEREFCMLRITRGKKKDTNQSRPFASMSRTYQMVQGEKWAATGTIFKLKVPTPPKAHPRVQEACMQARPSSAAIDGSSHGVSSPPQYPPSCSEEWESRGGAGEQIAASNVMVQIRDQGGHLEHCSLQQFLEVTGAHALYRRSLLESAAGQKRARAGGFDESEIHRGLFGNAAHPDYNSPTDASKSMRPADVKVAVSNLWSACSLGDQAYFFRRKAGQAAFSNGSVVRLVNGELCTDLPLPGGREEGMHMVVSDLNAKWKGEPYPTAEEEEHGHWCCFLGQVPISVEGRVVCGDLLGPRGDGSGRALVVQSGEGAPIIGVALADKSSPAQGVVKVLCFAGLGALTRRSDHQYHTMLQRMLDTELKISQLEGSVLDVKQQVKAVKVDAEENRDGLLSLTDRVYNVEQLVISNKLKEMQQEPKEMGEKLDGQGSSGIMVWDTFSNGGHRNMKMLGAAACCCLLILLAVLLGVFLGAHTPKSNADDAISPHAISNGAGSDIYREPEWIEGSQDFEVTGTTWECEIEVRLSNVDVITFQNSKAEFLAALLDVLPEAPGAKTTNVNERQTADRRLLATRAEWLATRAELQIQHAGAGRGGPAMRRLLGVATEVEIEIYAFSSRESALEISNMLEERQGQLKQKVKDELFTDMSDLHIYAWRMELDQSGRARKKGSGAPPPLPPSTPPPPPR